MSVELTIEAVSHKQIYLYELTFFLFKQKVGLFLFQQRKVLLEQFLKCI